MARPTLPISDYCKAFYTWFKCIRAAHAEDPTKFPWAEHLLDIELAISKSSLLERLIYRQQEHRLNKCPKHRGEWSGLPSPNNNCGCDFTGWVPNTYDEETAVNGWIERSAARTHETWYYWERDWHTRSSTTWPTKAEAVAAWREYEVT